MFEISSFNYAEVLSWYVVCCGYTDYPLLHGMIINHWNDMINSQVIVKEWKTVKKIKKKNVWGTRGSMKKVKEIECKKGECIFCIILHFSLIPEHNKHFFLFNMVSRSWVWNSKRWMLLKVPWRVMDTNIQCGTVPLHQNLWQGSPFEHGSLIYAKVFSWIMVKCEHVENSWVWRGSING